MRRHGRYLLPLLQFPSRHRHASLPLAQQLLADYLHSTRSLPFAVAEHIARNSPRSLSSVLSSLPSLHPSLLLSSLRRRLSFHPPDDLPFFLESIGLPPSTPSPPLPSLLPAAAALLDFGFPWERLGALYLHSPALFLDPPPSLSAALARLAASGLDHAAVVAACLVFPSLLHHPPESETLILRDLRLALASFRPDGSVADCLDRCLRLCKRVAFMHEIGCERGQLGDFMAGRWPPILASEALDLEGTIRFLCALGFEPGPATELILQHPHLLRIGFLDCAVSMPGFLQRAGLDRVELDQVCRRHPYAMGRNLLANLPGCLRALGCDRWLLDKVRGGDLRCLSREFLDDDGGELLDAEFQRELSAVKAAKLQNLLPKLEFLQSLGFGRNAVTIRALRLLTGDKEDLKARFDCLLGMGIEYSDLCKMISANPKLLNRKPEVLQQKVSFLCNELGLTVKYLNRSPAYLSFDLENRVKPRFRMLDWLRSKGLFERKFMPSMVISVSEKRYVGYLRNSHPAAPKFWFEVFKFNNHRNFYSES